MRYRPYRNPMRRAFGGLYSIVWMLMVVLFFVTHTWIWFVVGALLSVILSVVLRLVTAGVIGAGLFGATSMFSNRQQQQPPYQQPYQPYQPYQQGYQAPPEQPGQPYQAGGQPYYQPPQQQPQYEQPQVQYPQEMPPPQQ